MGNDRLDKNLQFGESILLDGHAILCFEASVTMDVKLVAEGFCNGLAACCFSGEGLFNTVLTGPGRVWCQSMSIDKMRKLFPPPRNDGGFDGGGDSDD